MANPEFYSRIIHKHDVETNWNTAATNSNFTPKQGEIIVYDKDSNYNYERIKIGDGTTNVANLPFIDKTLADLIGTKSDDKTYDTAFGKIAKAQNAAEEAQAEAESAANNSYVNASISGKVITLTKGDGTSKTLTTQDTTYGAATSSALGLVKSASSTTGDVEVDTNGFMTVKNDSHNHVISNIDGLSDKLTTLESDVKNASVLTTGTLPAARLSAASSSTLGGVKIGYAENGKNYPVELNSSNQMYVNVPWTHYTTGITAGASGTTTNAATSNPYVKIKDDSTHRSQIQIKGGGATTVSSDANGVITISSTDNNTTYTLSSFGITATAAELNKLDGVTATSTELNYVDGVTGKIQDQLDTKVSKTGDTMTGELRLQHPNITSGTPGISAGYARYLKYMDNDENMIAHAGIIESDTTSYYRIRVWDMINPKNNDGAEKYVQLSIGHNASGLPYLQTGVNGSVHYSAGTSGNVRNIQVQNSSGTTVATGRIIMQRK